MDHEELMRRMGPEFPPGSDISPLVALAGEAGVPGDVPAAMPAATIDRRDLFKLLGASAALAGLGACNELPNGKILPYVEQPPEVTPGLPVEYATSMVLDGFATGLLVQSREGRPVKIEGNPEHPASLGSTGVLEQAAVLSLYDPDRARSPLDRGLPRSWADFFAAMTGAEGQRGLRFLLPPQSSPLVAELIRRIQLRHPGAAFTFYDPLERGQVYEGARRVFGRPLEAQYDFQRADVVLSLDADFMSSMPNSVRWSRDFAGRRRLSGPADEMSRLYVVETSFTPTGSIADHRLAIRTSMVAQIAAGVLAALVGQGLRPAGMPDDVAGALAGALAQLDAGPHAVWIRPVARNLARHAGRGLVLAGPRQPADTHVLVHAINAALGNLGRTVTFTEPALLDPLGTSLAGLVADMRAGAVETLVMLEVNPVYTAPPELEFADALRQVPRTVHLSLHHDETSPHCLWSLPAAHFLESWGDARSYDGTISFVQPLYGGRSAIEVLAAFAGMPDVDGHTLMQTFWFPRLPTAPSAQWHWERNLQRGLLEGSRLAAVPEDALAIAWPEAVTAATTAATRAPGSTAPAPATPGGPGNIELAFEVSPTVHDGRFANNPWLLELPQPITRLTWDNAALVSPATAARLGVSNEDVVALARGTRRLQAPILVMPGHADDAITLHLGWGRSGSESLARGHGVNAYQLRTSDALAFAPDVTLARTGATYELATTQGLGMEHRRQHDREVALYATLSHYRAHPDFTSAHKGPHASMLPQRPRTGNQWAMTIDTMICTGCSACVIACQAENNIPVVGKSGVEAGRQMHWLDIDTYFVDPSEAASDVRPEARSGAGSGAPGHDIDVVHQPMLCQHCEHAPCEYVCPVYATTHSPDGINEMTYNRCIGTRFCSNNCPYKVRRFNWFEYQEGHGARDLQRNPDVTVRARGVIEKCTYCVQRIRRAEMKVRMQDGELPVGAVTTACQQACPTGAIQFASLHHEDTPAVRWRREARSYAVLHELGTRPRNIYLAKIRNPNPELASTGSTGGSRGA